MDRMKKKKKTNKIRTINPLRVVLITMGFIVSVGAVGYGGYCAYTHYDKQNKEIRQLNANLETKTKLLAESEANLELKQGELKKANTEIDALTIDKANKQAKIEEMQNNINMLSAKKSELQTQLEASNANLGTVTTERDNLQTRIDNCTTQIETLQKEKEALDKEINDLDKQIAKKNNQIDELNAIVTRLTNEVNELKQGIEGYTITEVQDHLTITLAGDDGTLTIESVQLMFGREIKRMANMGIESYEICDKITVSKDNNNYITYANANKYVAKSDAEAQSTSITINKIDLSTLEDEANYKVNITLRESEIYEGTNVVKTAIFDMDIVVVPTLDKLSFEPNMDNASYNVKAVDKSISGCVVIPDYYKGLPVTSIEYQAFQDCSGITKIVLPESVTNIDTCAFSGCTSLTGIIIPKGTRIIGHSAFYDCNSLTSVTIPDSVTTIDVNAFVNCAKLTSITIPNSVNSIGQTAFSGCAGLISIDLSNCKNLTTIDANSFQSCTSLTNIVIPESVTIIDGVFAVCGNLTSVTIKATIPPLLRYDVLFSQCSSDLTIYVPAESVDAYKTASGWSDYADKIQAIVEEQ